MGVRALGVCVLCVVCVRTRVHMSAHTRKRGAKIRKVWFHKTTLVCLRGKMMDHQLPVPSVSLW